MAKKPYVPHRLYLRKGPNEELFTLRGLEEISKYLRIHLKTVKRYIKTMGLPCMVGLDGRYFTTRGAIDLWVMRLAADQRRERYGEDVRQGSEETV